MARLYTRTGDKGETGLANGRRVTKNHLRLHNTGTLDELNAWLGLVIADCDQEDIRDILQQVQSELFDLGAQVANPDPERRRSYPTITSTQVERLERWIDAFQQEVEELRVFILPGGDRRAAQLHVARTVCRRAERLLVALREEDQALAPELFQYLNRLSDLLFVLARVQNHRHQVAEPRWEPHIHA